MRSLLYLLLTVLSVTVVCGNRARLHAQLDAVPTEAPANGRRLRQMSRKELVARAKYPDMFGKRQNQPSEEDPSSSSSSDSAAATQPPNQDCSSSPGRKRAVASKPEKPLEPQDMAKFLMGKGEFTWANGTVYHDDHYVEIMQKAGNNYPSWYYRAFNTVRDSVGNKLLEMSVPTFKKWKRGLDDGEMIWMSDQTAFRARDIDAVIGHLLEDSTFDELQVHGYKISRRFFEAAASY